MTALASASLVHMHVTRVTDSSFTADVLESDVPVLVDFTASWCPPCRVMKPVLAELAAERTDMRFVELDVDANPETVIRHGVLSMPTFILFAGGQPVARLVGARPKARLAAELSEAVPPAGEQVLVQQTPGG